MLMPVLPSIMVNWCPTLCPLKKLLHSAKAFTLGISIEELVTRIAEVFAPLWTVGDQLEFRGCGSDVD